MKRYFITLSLLAVAMAAMAQLTARTAFAEAPSSVFPLLDKLTRLGNGLYLLAVDTFRFKDAKEIFGGSVVQRCSSP